MPQAPHPIEGAKQLVLVFCTAELPVVTLNRFLARATRHSDIEETRLRIVDTKDLTTITKAHDNSHLITEPFISPFLNYSLEQLEEWFTENVTDKRLPGFSLSEFVVLDNDALPRNGFLGEAGGDVESDLDEDPNDIESIESALLCSTRNQGHLEMVSCDFYVTLQRATELHIGGIKIGEDPVLGCFMRSGYLLTRGRYGMASSNGWYMEKGDVQRNENWVAFLRDWSIDGELTRKHEEEWRWKAEEA